MNCNHIKLLTYLLFNISLLSNVHGEACTAQFLMSGSGNRCGSGYFTVNDVTGGSINIGDGSSGFMNTANDSRYVQARDIGALPAGRYQITLENDAKNTFRLNPLPGTQMHDRNGMLIHGFNNNQTRAEASRGCIILDYNQRRKLRQYLNECRELELRVVYQ